MLKSQQLWLSYFFKVWDFEAIDTADSTDESGVFEMDPMNELKVGDGVQLKTIIKSVDPENEPTIWYAQVGIYRDFFGVLRDRILVPFPMEFLWLSFTILKKKSQSSIFFLFFFIFEEWDFHSVNTHHTKATWWFSPSILNDNSMCNRWFVSFWQKWHNCAL